jgi:hypothetical protein
MKTSAIASWAFLLMMFNGMAATGPDAVTLVKMQLPSGKTSGTYAFSYTGKVVFSQESAFPVQVELRVAEGNLILKVPVKDGSPFTLSTDLAPGSYWIGSMISASPSTSPYFNSELIEVFISLTGMESMRSSSSDTLLHRKKMTVLEPGTMVDIPAGTMPLIKWQPQPGAVKYRIYWREIEGWMDVMHEERAETAETQFQLTGTAISNRCYEWGVEAVGKDGESLAYGYGNYFFTPGGRESYKNAAQAMTRGYMGMSAPDTGIKFVRKTDGGLAIVEVAPGSPALQGGLEPGDILTSLNGKSLVTMKAGDFYALLRSQSVGTIVSFEYIRQGAVKSAKVPIGIAF